MGAANKLPANIDYEELQLQRTSELQTELKKKLERRAELSRVYSVRYTILRFVVEGNYEAGRAALDRFVEMKSEYPMFQERVQPYLQHAKEIMHAIEAKRSFRKVSQLSRAKQQEMIDRVTEHFDELKHYLSKIEAVERDAKVNDARSTVWVVKALVHAILWVAVVGMFVEASNWLGGSFNTVLNSFVDKLLKISDTFF